MTKRIVLNNIEIRGTLDEEGELEFWDNERDQGFWLPVAALINLRNHLDIVIAETLGDSNEKD